jgi:thioredoxin 1
MIKYLFYVIFVLSVLACSSSDSNSSQTPVYEVNNLSINEFKSKLSSLDGILLDVRTETETSQGYIPGASFINLYDENFIKKINLIQKNKPVFVYCKMGGRSAKASKELINVGFKEVYNLNGGIQAWYDNGYEIIKDSIIPALTQEFTIEQFDSLISQSSKSNIVCFQTKWCLPCKKMHPILSEISDSLKNDVNIIKIDMDRNIALSKRFHIKSVPTFIGLTNGEVKWEKIGFTEKEDLLNLIDKLKI